MGSQEQIIHRFYSAFRQLDYATMQSCYSEDAVFNDPVFGILIGREVRSMWEMLCKQAGNFSLTYANIEILDDEYATCVWTATYEFSKTRRKVINRIKAHLRIQNEKIVEHTDQFDLWRWSRQALGVSGWLLGWSGLMKNKIRRKAAASLGKFMSQNHN